MNFKDCKAMVFDVDGVFTNGDVLITEEGELLRSMNTKDGYMVRRAIEVGLHLAIITGGTSEGVVKRLNKLGIKEIYSGVNNKMDVFLQFLEKHQLSPEEVGFTGDDFPDYEILQNVGFPCCPSDSVPEIAAICKYISPFEGGKGVVRDVLVKLILSKDLSLI